VKKVTQTRIPSETIDVAVYTCDKCGRPSGDLRTGAYDRVETTIASKSVTSYGTDGGSSEATVFDCCADCFKKHVVPAMVALGFTVREEEENW
jgi:hypothetical protein